MRPLVLKIRGLRSYRSEVEIDFRGRNLAAVIGDTGAGKSSILEAICLALYGTATWDGNTVRELISASETSLSVEFRFRADGKDWTVTRSSRNTGTALHKLTCADDATQKFDSASSVNARIRELVGLDYKGFLRTVVLPQGRFQQLLQATTSDRNNVLKGIFRVDELEAVRVVADNARTRLSIALAEQVGKRGALIPNPVLAAAEASETIVTASSQVESYEAAQAAYRTASDERVSGLARVETLRNVVLHIGTSRRPDDAATFAALAARAVELDTLIHDLQARFTAAEATASDLEGRLKDTEAAGLGSDGLAAAASVLQWATGELPQLREERDRLNNEASALEAAEAGLVAQRVEVGLIAARASEASETVASAAVIEREEVAVLNAARDALREVRRLSGEREMLSTEQAQLSERAAALDEKIAASEAALAAASAELRSAEDTLAAARRMDHAAAASAGVGPGDPCPVCARELPAGFVPVHSHDEATALAARDAAATAERQAHTTATGARAGRVATTEEEQRLASRIILCDQKLSPAITLLEAILVSPDLALPDAELLGPLAARADAATSRVAERRVESADCNNEATVARTSLSALESGLASSHATLDAAKERLNLRRRKYEDALTGLPPALRPARTVDEGAIEASTAACAELTALANMARDQLNVAIQEARVLRRDLDTHREERSRSIEAPVQELRIKQATLVQALVSAAALLEEPYQQPLAGASFALETAASDAAASDQQALHLLAAAERVSGRARAESDAAEARMSAALAAASCASLPDLDHARIGAAAALSTARQRHAEAVRQQPIVEVLDRRIVDARELHESLETIRVHFSDSKFIGFVLRNRQKILLAVGSEVLASMTGGRYGFAEDFRIVDSWSGQPRDVMTLSGGETFLASLALALGLVELAGRSGGKLDALFLDEGFGSLDANTLPDALRALEGQASGGRFVAVISHLRAVAESFDHVLHVTRSPSGSQAHWLTGEEREAMLGSDAESGLLS